MKKSQTESIKEFLEAGNKLTPLSALYQFGCLRLGARIYDLKRKHGMNIDSQLVRRNGHHFSEYSLKKQADEAKTL